MKKLEEVYLLSCLTMLSPDTSVSQMYFGTKLAAFMWLYLAVGPGEAANMKQGDDLPSIQHMMHELLLHQFMHHVLDTG